MHSEPIKFDFVHLRVAITLLWNLLFEKKAALFKTMILQWRQITLLSRYRQALCVKASVKLSPLNMPNTKSQIFRIRLDRGYFMLGTQKKSPQRMPLTTPLH